MAYCRTVWHGYHKHEDSTTLEKRIVARTATGLAHCGNGSGGATEGHRMVNPFLIWDEEGGKGITRNDGETAQTKRKGP